MRKTTILYAAAAMLAVAPTAGLAQFGPLTAMIPGGGMHTSGVGPDKFLADTIETTKFVMISAAILRDAASEAPDKAALAEKLKAINDANDVKELDAHRLQMDQDIQAINDNKNLSSDVQANLAHADARQREQIAAATFNFALGAFRNVQLAQEAPHVVDAVKSNPMLTLKIGKVMTASRLIMDEAQQTAGMMGSLHIIMTAGNIEEPKPAETTKPHPVDLGA